MRENQNCDKKSLKIITGKTANWDELAKDCVGFANVRGGIINIGIEDSADVPDANQRIPEDLPARIQKRISELTVNVGVVPEIEKSANGGEYIRLKVLHSSSTIASTTDGKYYYRSSDTTVPLLPDELSRLFTDKPSFVWETRQVKSVPKSDIDTQKLEDFVSSIKKSERVSSFIKAKTTEELLEHYLMSDGDYLTNLGVLWVGKRTVRAKLSYSPVIQFLKYDENGTRINRILWDDYSRNPAELLEAVWTQIPDWKEGVEVSDGLFRKFVPNYEEDVIREILTNALVHRPYTTRGDIFINLYPDRLEICNPGLLPIGVTPQNILHKSVRRNEKLAQIFYDLMLMEREGSGYDKVYEILLSNGKQIPETIMEEDSVKIVIRKRIAKPEIISFLNRVNDEYHLNQKETICLGLIIQQNSLSAVEFSRLLELPDEQKIRSWLGRLQELKIVLSRGQTKGTNYFINPKILQATKFKGSTNLKRIESHRLKELIYQDLLIYPNSAISATQERIGKEIPRIRIFRCLEQMVKDNQVTRKGERKWSRYFITQNSNKKSDQEL
ncbi:MAG: putative DNA binding domain-containing protein [Prevotellaceae bacterium]|jgi:ATP-dependent DNA helicase RecG|nr:putative DNA binding domain-containing protein [Prevotellaceae bacterium]